jgi:hypothetical protein
MQPIPWTEWPTGALVGARSLWALSPDIQPNLNTSSDNKTSEMVTGSLDVG